MTATAARITLPLLLLCAAALTIGAGPATAPTTISTAPVEAIAGPSPAVVVALHGEIDDYSRDALFKHFERAKSLGAKTIILDINTYGGMVTSGLDIARFLKRQDDLHIVAFVNDKAISAGAMIAMACNEIVMVPGSVIGDCAPIAIGTGGDLQPLPAAERAKMESPILADFYHSAVRNHHNTLVAEAMVATDRSVHYVTKGDERRFVSDADYEKLKKEEWKPVKDVPDPIDSSTTLLTVHSDLAEKIGLAVIAPSAESFAAEHNYHIVASLEPSAGDKIVGVLGSAAVRGILLVIFLQALYIAFSSPGHGAAEAIAVVALGMLLGVPLLTGYAQWYEILIILAGVALVAFEVFVFPGHFVSAIVGIVMIVGGLVMTFVPKEPGGMPGVLPSFEGTYAAIRTGAVVVVGGLACSLMLWMWISRFLPRLPYLNRLILSTTSPSPMPAGAMPDAATDFSSVATEPWPAIGTIGVAITDLRPGGSAQFPDPVTGDTRITDVVSESGFVPANSKIAVRTLRGSYAVVRAV
jgi:membrane-bound serine protease (ClpP class)